MYVLEKLWREGLSPSERFVRKGSEYQRLMQKLCRAEDDLSKVLNDDGKVLLERYIAAQQEVITCSEQETFIHAFRMGAQMVLDIVDNYRGSFYGQYDDD